jgi:hypothetical protein
VHRGGYCHEVCERCMEEDDLDAGMTLSELGVDPEEEWDYDD